MPYTGYPFHAGNDKQATDDDISKHVFVVDMREELDRFFGDLLQRGMNKVLAQGGKVLIIHNQKSYAKGLICPDCGHLPQCSSCDVSVSYHQPNAHTSFGMCHVCKQTYPTHDCCPQCGSEHYKTFGIGLEQIAQWVNEKFAIEPLLVTQKTADSRNKITTLWEQFPEHHVVLATSLLCQPVVDDDEQTAFDLIVFMDADRGLSVPNYGAARDTFSLLYDTINQHRCPTVIIQTRKPDHPAIACAAKGDVNSFEEWDQAFRKAHYYPPYGELCVLSYKHEVETKVFGTVNKLYQDLLYLQEKWSEEKNYDSAMPITIYATPAMLYKAYNKYRYHIIIAGPSVRAFVEHAVAELQPRKKGFRIDWGAREVV